MSSNVNILPPLGSEPSVSLDGCATHLRRGVCHYCAYAHTSNPLSFHCPSLPPCCLGQCLCVGQCVPPKPLMRGFNLRVASGCGACIATPSLRDLARMKGKINMRKLIAAPRVQNAPSACNKKQTCNSKNISLKHRSPSAGPTSIIVFSLAL